MFSPDAEGHVSPYKANDSVQFSCQCYDETRNSLTNVLFCIHVRHLEAVLSNGYQIRYSFDPEVQELDFLQITNPLLENSEHTNFKL
jgi:hypothetical protein